MQMSVRVMFLYLVCLCMHMAYKYFIQLHAVLVIYTFNFSTNSIGGTYVHTHMQTTNFHLIKKFHAVVELKASPALVTSDLMEFIMCVLLSLENRCVMWHSHTAS